MKIQIVGAVAVALGAGILLLDGGSVGAGFHSALTPSLGLDRLSAFFVLVVAVAAVPALLYACDALQDAPHAGALAGLTAAFLLSLLLVLVARDVVTFLVGWELMTLLPASAILLVRRDASTRRTVFVYLAITHLGGVGVWVALLALADVGAIGGTPPSGGVQALVAGAALVGFGTKAGLMPLHAWLPRAHPVAPSHVSALMSGVMVKVALYGLIRVLFEWDAPAPLWAGFVLMGLGLLSALAGVIYALVARELKRLLAFSTIENVGIVALGLGASIVLAQRGAHMWAALAFAAALLHVANHAAIKALLFLCAGAFGGAVGSLELDRLGGLLSRMPWCGWPFLVGCGALAGVPLLAGFASEWLTLQALLQLAYQSAPGVALVGALAAAGLAATAGLAAFCFVKVAGLVLLGSPRGEAGASRIRVPAATRGALAGAAAVCVALGLVPGVLVPLLAGLAPGDASVSAGIALALPGTGGLPALGVAVVLVLLTALVRLATRSPRAARSPAWACGQPVVPALAWTSAGFAKPLRLVLEAALRPRRAMALQTRHGVVQAIAYRTEVPHLFDAWLYAPAHRVALRSAAVARRLQAGSMRVYLGYLLAVLAILLALVRLGWLA